eukprot:3241480-Rhodomonas_salina.1
MTQSKLRGKVGVLLAGTLVVAMADENCSSIARWTQLSSCHRISPVPFCPEFNGICRIQQQALRLWRF